MEIARIILAVLGGALAVGRGLLIIPWTMPPLDERED
jgi:hypothetical protein